ncbi:MAG: VWA domain-containing protein [Gammaproteobacteria bacterium]|nr:VWA domain-containing protein [Gammaproteobacteria bacterium]
MTEVLTNFIKVLRAASVRISTAESIDAAAALACVGFENRAVLKIALSQVLAKTPAEKVLFHACFDRFFTFEKIQTDQPDALTAVGAEGAEGVEVASTQATESGAPTGLVALLEGGEQPALELALALAARAVQLQNIRLFTQRGQYVRRILEQVGIDDYDAVMFGLLRENPDDPRGAGLRALKHRLMEDVSALVDRQMLLYTAAAWPSLREEILEKTPLTRIEMRDFKVMQQLVRKLAKRLVSLHSRRRRVARRGQLDVRRTIRRNLQYDGLLFDTVWKRTRIDRPKVIAVCDVSGSVAQVARFLLLFLYSMSEVLPQVRSFAFSNQLGEVTQWFEQYPAEVAVAQTLRTYGLGSTDYGGALAELERLTLADIDHRTTVIILGDARSNYGDPGAAALRRIQTRARRVLWLNPEPRSFWDLGDSAMQKLGACCDRVESCRTLVHLERVVSEIARTAV